MPKYPVVFMPLLTALVLGVSLGASTQEVQTEEPLRERAASLFAPVPARPPELPANLLTPEKTELGKMLFFDPRLSASHFISCHSCHNVGLGGIDLQQVSIGHGWQTGPRNAPTVFNAVFNIAQFWDGRAADLAEQAQGPVQAAVEMNNTPERLKATLKSIPEYVERFENAFPKAEKPLSFDTMARAIEAFEATLITPNARFDQFLRGGDALSEAELEGLTLFMDKGCAGCHNGSNVGGRAYYPFGVIEAPSEEIRPSADLGRATVTNTSADEYVFKAPSLRNVELTAPYFHSGAVWTLEEAVDVMGAAQLGIQLNGDEVKKITAFLRTLTGEQPQVVHPVLPPNSSTTPRPILLRP